MVTNIPDDIRDRTYFHATSNEKAGETILQNRIIRPPTNVGKGFQSPIRGRVYLAQTEEEAAIYAMGGVITPGPDAVKGLSHGRFGYVFIVDGHDLVDIQPDEDSIGEMVYDALNDSNVFGERLRTDPVFRERLRSLATTFLTSRQRWFAKQGDAIWLSHIGKRLVRELPEWMQVDMIRRGANIAHHGSLPVQHAFRFDRRLRVPIFSSENQLFRRPVHVRRHRRQR